MSPAQPTSPLPQLERFLSSPRHNPTALRLILAAQLRRLRLAAQLSPAEAGEVLWCSESKISRLERGEVQLKERDVADLLRRYRVGAREAEEFCSLVQRSNQSGWWHQFDDVLPKWFDKFIGLQEAASVIRTYEVLLMPGLLQTPEYARAGPQGAASWCRTGRLSAAGSNSAWRDRNCWTIRTPRRCGWCWRRMCCTGRWPSGR
ncbi:Scr1 family TA system antitoxin-like transcriptional regulator [Streptomyces sp. NPDC020707]|uniref:helix-turn-helix domain-containing protein n=1 Tax=Streptomyces sp. NPDC020707 TaxID=3365084 RepID=UPI00379F9925